MSQITITKGKLLKNDKLEIEYQKNDGTESKPAECVEKHSSPPRKELKLAFESLKVHVALLGEFIPIQSVKDIHNPDPELIKNFNVSGFTMVGEDEGVILSAQKTLKTGSMGFNTPIIRVNDESDNPYPHLEELSKSIENCKDEIRQYLNGAFAPNPQGKLELAVAN